MLGVCNNVFAQEDTTAGEKDIIIKTGNTTVIADSLLDASTTNISRSDTAQRKKQKLLFEPDPKKAGMFASILPGSGQVYNRQYWKLPIVYAILGTAGYFIWYNYDQYREFRTAYISRLDASTANDQYPLYDISDLKRIQDGFRQDLDIIVLLTTVGYAAQILDAVASAHLRNFDISPDISMELQPVIGPNYAGVGLVLNFK